MALTGGCDIPDRHNVGLFRQPAAWEVQPPVDTDGGTTLSRLITPSETSPETVSPSNSWFFHHVDRQPSPPPDGPTKDTTIDPTNSESVSASANHAHTLRGVVGVTRISSEPVADSPELNRDSNPNPFASVRSVHLKERVLAEPIPSANRFDPDTRFGEVRYRCLNLTDQRMWHAADGRVNRIQCVVRRGPLESRSTVIISGDEIRFSSEDSAGTRDRTIRHQGPVFGPWMVSESLLDAPIRRGQTRTSRVILPVQEKLATLTLRGQPDALAKVWLGDRIDQQTLHEAIAITDAENPGPADREIARERLYWFDDQGQVLSTQIPSKQKFTYRCDEQHYQQFEKRLAKQTYPVTVDIPGKPIPDGQVRQLAFQIQLPKLPNSLAQWPPSVRLTTAPRQYSQSVSPTQQRVIVTESPVPESKLAGRFDRFPTESTPEKLAEDLAANRIIDHRSAAVRRILGLTASPANRTKAEKADELNRTVHGLLSFTPLSQGIRPASEIATTTLADSTEHAILLVAMLRASGIPSRIAFGLRHLPLTDDETREEDHSDGASRGGQVDFAITGNRFVYHTWVVAGIENDWISLDPTTGEKTAANCLTLWIDPIRQTDPESLFDQYLARLQSLRLSVDGAVMK